MSVQSRRRFVALRTGVVGVVSAALALGGFAGIAHADPVNWTSVTNEASLETALGSADQNIVLANDISVSDQVLSVPYATTINVAGHALTTQNITIGSTSSLEVVDEDADGNTLTTGSLDADATEVGSRAGITVGANTDGFSAHDITLTAIGSPNGSGGAGIGGDSATNANSGRIEIDDSTLVVTGGYHSAAVGSGKFGQVVRSITIDNTAVTATAGADAAVVGGGLQGAVYLDTNLDITSLGKPVTLNGSPNAPVLGVGADAVANEPGEWDLQGNVTLNSPGYLNVPSDGGSYTLKGTISGDGAITGDGTLASSADIPWHGNQLSGDVTITGYNYPIAFNAEGGSPASQTVNVHGTTFAGGGVSAPSTIPVIAGGIFADWDHDGQAFSTSDNITGITEYDAVYNPITSISIVEVDGGTQSGDTQTFHVNGSDDESDTVDQSQFVTITSTDSSDQIDGNQVTYGKAGSRTLTVALHEQGTDPQAQTYQVSTDPGPATDLNLMPSASSVLVGGSLTFTVKQEDAGGDILDNDTSSAVLTSSIGADAVVGDTVTFASAGYHAITATLGDLTGTYYIDVIPTATPKRLYIEGSGTATAGEPAELFVVGVNASGATLGEYTTRVKWSGLNKTDVVGSDNTLTFTAAGQRTLKATIGKVSATFRILVLPAALDHIGFVKPATKVVAGSTTVFSVHGYDVYGNDLGVDTNASFGVSTPEPGEDTSSSHVVLTLAGFRTLDANDPDAADSSGNFITTDVHVVAAPMSELSVTADSASDPVLAGTVLHFSVAGADAYANSFGDVTAASKLSSSVSSDKIVKNAVTFTKAGSHTITVEDGKASTTYDVAVSALAVADAKFAFDEPTTTGHLNVPLSVQLDTADVYGNPLEQADTATYAVSGSGATIDNSTLDLTATKLGKYTVTATVGTVKVSETITITKSTATVGLTSGSIPASTPNFTYPVSLLVDDAAPAPSGTVTLHYGSASATLPVTGGEADFPLPALKAGSYVFSASYSGDANYVSVASAKHTIIVVPGALDHLTFIKPATSVVAGKATKFTVYGYDANNNFIADETAFADFVVDGNGTSGSPITFTTAGASTLTATIASVTASTAVTVKVGALANFEPSNNISADAVAGTPFTFTAVGFDASGNSLGSETSKLSIKSSVSSDKISKNTVTATKSGPRTYTLKVGKLSSSWTLWVDAADAVPGKYAFASPATKSYLDEPANYALRIGLDSVDRFGNLVQPAQDLQFSSTVESDSFSSDYDTVSFSTTGKRTISVTTADNVTLHETITVAKDVASITFDHSARLPDTASTITATVGAGGSGLLPTGTVTLHYGTQTISAIALDDENAQATFDVPALTGKSYVMYVTYSGDDVYATGSSKKFTVTTDGVAFG